MFHNHIDKDYSYNWITPDKYEKLTKETPIEAAFAMNKFVMGKIYLDYHHIAITIIVVVNNVITTIIKHHNHHK